MDNDDERYIRRKKYSPIALIVAVFAASFSRCLFAGDSSTAPPLPKLRSNPSSLPLFAMKESVELKQALEQGKLGFDKLLLIQRREINPTHVYTHHNEGFGAGGGLCIYSLSSGELTTLVASPEGQILDCELSFDGREVLFSWRRNLNDSYHIFSANMDGTGLKQLTQGDWHDYNACWLPDGAIAFLSTRSARFAYCWTSPVGVLHRMDRDGTHVRRLSSNIINDITPSLMENGRIVYTRWEYVDKPAIPIQSLWTINPDGTGLHVFFGNRVLSPATFMEARSIPRTGKVLCTMTSHNGPTRGAIGIIDPVFGVNAQQAITNLTPEVNIGRVDKGDGNNIKGAYETPFPVDAEYYLVSRRGTILLRDFACTRQTAVIAPRSDLGFYSAQPVRARSCPPAVASALPSRTDEEGWATVFVQDVYNGLEPIVKRGEVKEICVVQELKKSIRSDVSHRAFGFQFPVISCGATYAAKQVWGYATVSDDGSAYFQVPAGIPIYFMALDDRGRAVQRMRSFTHLMPGETQSCIGCHENRNQTPSARKTSAQLGQAQELRKPEWGIGGFDYSRVVQPVLDRHCVSCHGGAAPAARVDLSGDKTDYFSVSYETLARGRKGGGLYDNPYVNWIPTYNGMESNILLVEPKTWGSPKSKLAHIVCSDHPDEDGKPRVSLKDADRRRILQWIDLNVPYYGTSESAYPENEGCRRIYPATLDTTLVAVAARRCVACHANGKMPREVWTRIVNPELNRFLMAPLARAAGGSETCGKAVFQNMDDPDYQAILKTFKSTTEMLQHVPRMDMPGAKAASNINRSCR